MFQKGPPGVQEQKIFMLNLQVHTYIHAKYSSKYITREAMENFLITNESTE